MGNLTAPEWARFALRVQFDNTDCHNWTGPLDKDGYGTFYLRRKSRKAHRVAWYNMRGEIPEGLVINHVCRNRACVNQQHLQLVTVAENTLKDSAALSAINARKTHCPRGHTYDRVYPTKTGRGSQRACSVCESAKRKRLRKKWAAEDTLRV